MKPHPETPTTTITLATRITLCRILGIPVFIGLLSYYMSGIKAGEPEILYRHLATAVFILVTLTDAVDGYVARRRNEITRLGAILDPIADKLLLLSGLIMLTRPNNPEFIPHIPIWFTTLVISRDAASILGAMIIHHISNTVRIRPHVTGKAATLFQVLTILLVLGRAPVTLFLPVLYAAAFFTAVSGILYLLDGIRQVEQPVPAHDDIDLTR